MESEDYKEGVSKWSRNVKDLETRISYRSRISKSYEDPMPEYISPELVMLIAQNAPSELDVFKNSFKWGKLPARTRSLDCQPQRCGIEVDSEVDCQKECEIQVILSSENEGKHNPKQSTMNTQRSCPEMVTWTDYDTKDSWAHLVKNVKRKRPKSLDICKPVSRDRRSSISVTSLRDKQEDDHTSTVADDLVPFLKSVDSIPSDIEQNLERPSSAPVVSASRYESAALIEKPWRHGMKKHTSTRLKQTESTSCKRKAEVDPKKLAEVKKYMETKFAQLRNQKHLQKARAEAAIAARKEKQRKLDVECQALLQSQATDVKTKQKTFSRPPWTSDYVTLAEVFRPWSRASTGNLPPPKVPRNQEPVPLDLYTSVNTYEAAQKSLFDEGCNRSSLAKSKKGSNKMKVRKGGKHLPRGKTTSDMYEMAFPPTHPYHILRPYPKTGTQKKTSLPTKARWKSKKKSLTRFNPEKIYQQKCLDLMANRKMEKTSCAPYNGRLRRETSARRMQKRNKNSSQKDITYVLQQDDCYAISALKQHERDICARSKVKRLRSTSPPTTKLNSLAQNDSKPKYSRVRPAKRGNVTVQCKELSLQGVIAEVMKSRLPPDSNRGTLYKTRDSISPGTMDSLMCRQASLNPQKHLGLGTVSQVLKPTTIELPSPCSSRNESKPQVFDPTREVLLSPNEHFKVEGTVQSIRPSRNDMTNADIEINKDVTRDLRRQRMRMLRSLAEQLVQRMDAACAEQQLRNTPKTISEPTSEPRVPSEPFNQSAGLYCLDEPLLVEPNFVNHSPRLDILYHAHLSELEQAGCQTVELPEKAGSEVISNVNHLSKDPFAIDNQELSLNVFSSHACNVIDKDMSMSDNILSGCSSYGRSSPSTDSNSAVILPTGAKYNIRRTKCNQNIEEQARKRQKEAWKLPEEEDIHSVINLYTQHWLSREMNKNQARCELTQTGEVESEENTCSRSRSCTSLQDHAPEKHKFKFGVAPIESGLEISEPCIRSLESNAFTSIKCAETSGVFPELLQSDHGKPLAYILQENPIHHINVADTPASVEKSMATIIAEPMQDNNEQKEKLTGDPGQSKPEGMLVQIGDMRLCPSPTSFHQRLATHKDDRQLKKPLRDLGTSERPSKEEQTKACDQSLFVLQDCVTKEQDKMENTAEDAYTPLLVSSIDSQTQTSKSPVIPMKITYARRVRRRNTPDGASTDDERIIVEFQRINTEGDELARQKYNTEHEPSRSSTSKTLPENLCVSMVEVQNLDHPSCNSEVQNGIHPTDESGIRDQPNVLQPETHTGTADISVVTSRGNGAPEVKHIQHVISRGSLGYCTNTEADNFTGLNFPIERFEEKLDLSGTKASHSVGDSGYPQLLNTTDQREGGLDGLPTKSSDFAGESICSKVNPELASVEAENWREKGDDQKTKQYTSKNSTTPSAYDRLSTFGSKNKSQYADNESILSDSAERHQELLSGSKLEVQSDLLQRPDNTLELQLKSRRHQLEVQLQKLDAEIRRSRAKLQANHDGSDMKTRKCNQSATSVITKDKSSTASSEKTDRSKTSEVLSGDLVIGRYSHPLPSNSTLLDPPRQTTTALLPDEATSAPIRTLDRLTGSPIHSTSFVSEDIEMEEGIFSTRILEMIPDTGGERYESQYELPCREPRFINQISNDCGVKTSPICQHYDPVKEVSEEEMLNCRTASTQEEVVDEGSENSTGRVPFRRFDRPSLCKRQEAKVPSAPSEFQRSPSGHTVDQIVTPAYQELQPVLVEERNDSILSRVSVEMNHLSVADIDFTHNAKKMRDETYLPTPLDTVLSKGEVETESTDTDFRGKRHNGCSYVPSTHNGRALNRIAIDGRESGSRSPIHLLQAKRVADKVHDGVVDNSTMDMRQDGTPYVAGIYSDLDLGNLSTHRRTMMTLVTKVQTRKTSRSSHVRKQWQVDNMNDLSSSSEDGVESSFLTQKAPKVEEVVEESTSSSRNGTEGKSKTRKTAINTACKLKREISGVVKVLPLSSSYGILQKSEPSACVSEPLLYRTSKQTWEGDQEGEGSCSSGKRENITNVFRADEISTTFHHSPTPHEILDGTPSELKEPLDLRENFEILTITRDPKNDQVRETTSLNLVEENPTTVNQDNDLSTPESGRMRRLWRLDSEVSQNLTEDSKAESTKQLLQSENKSLTKSEGDKAEPVRNLPTPDVDTLTAAVPQVRPKMLRQSHEYDITFEVGGLECFQQASKSSVSVAKGTISDGAVEVIPGSSNARIENSSRPSDLPYSGDPLPQSYISNSAKAPVRGQWSLYDCGHNGTVDQISASTDFDQRTNSLTDLDSQVVPSFCKQMVPIFFPAKTHAPTACEKSSEVEEFQRILLESSRTGGNTSTALLEVDNDFIAAREDELPDCSEVNHDCEGFRPVQPSILMSKYKAGYQELASIDDDMRKTQQRLLPPVLLETATPSEISPTRFTDNRGEELLKADESTSRVHQPHIPDIKCDLGTDVASVERSEKDASAMLIALSRTLMRSIDTTEIPFGGSIRTNFKDTASSSSCGQSGGTVGNSPIRTDLGLHKETTGDLDDLDGECENQYSSREPSGAWIHTVTSGSSGSSSLTTAVANDEDQEMETNACQEEVGLVSNSHMEDMATQGGIAADVLVSRSYFCARGKVLTALQEELRIPKSTSPPPKKLSEESDEESLTQDVSSSKPNSSPRSIGEEDCLDVSQNRGHNLDLERESSWSEDEGKSDEPQTISCQSADDKFDGKEAFKGTLERLQAREEKHVSTPETIHNEFTGHLRAPQTACVSEEAHRLVECFLSSGSQLLDRAGQVSNAFATCSIVHNSPGNLSSAENCDQRIVPTADDSSLFRGLPSRELSTSSATEQSEDGQRHDVFTCEPDEAKAPEILHPSRPDQIIALRSSNPAHRQSGNSTLDSKSAFLDRGTNENDCKQDLNSVFTTPSGHDKITAQQSSASRLFPSRDLFSSSQHCSAPLESTTKDNVQHKLETNPSFCVKDKTSTGTELSEYIEFTSSIPQLASALAISLQIPDPRESSSNCYGDKLCLSRENSTVEIPFEVQENRERHLSKLSTEETSTAGYDKDSICSLDESGESKDLAATLEGINVQTAASRTRKHNMMADTLTDMLFETLLAEGLSDLASPSRSKSPTSSTEDTRTTPVSRTPRPKTKGNSNKGFIGVLKHFLPVGWRAVSPKHKTGLFLQVKGLKPHPLTSAYTKALSGTEGFTGTLQNKYPPWDDFKQSSLVHRATTETAVPLFTNKEYLQCYVEKTLRLANRSTDPSPSNWYDSTVPIAQDIYEEVLETDQGALKQGDWQIQHKLLFDLTNESVIKYSDTLHRSPSSLPFPNDGRNVVQFVTSSILEQVTSQSTHGSDVDKVVRRLFEDEQWEKCYEETRDLISELAQGILSDLIERFVQEMIQGKNITINRFRVSV